MGEGEYLENQCQQAKAGMRLAMHELKGDAIEIADPRIWARAHPLAAVGAAFVAGFAVTKVIEREAEPAEASRVQANPVAHRPGRMARLFSAGMKIWAVAQPFVRAAVIARMNQSDSAQQHS